VEPSRQDGRVIGVAVPIPDPWNQELADARKRFGDPTAGLIPPHITLLPPTAIDESVFQQTEGHLHAVAASQTPFDVHLRGTGSFRPVSPVVFVAVAAGISDCERLERGVRSGPLERELFFPYHPHVTVAHDLPEVALQRAYDELADYEARFNIGSFQLYEHGDDGVWRSLHEFALRGTNQP
jgi:2'-5' RNA ligase